MDLPSNDPTEIALRLLAATAAGMALGCNRDLQGKPTGMRTLGLVALGSALVAVTVVSLSSMRADPNAMSRVIQGIIQGLMAGVGFIGAGVVLRRPEKLEVHGLTTAATVWVTAALGIAAAIATWRILVTGLGIALLLLVLGGPLERFVAWASNGRAKGPASAKVGNADRHPGKGEARVRDPSGSSREGGTVDPGPSPG